LIRHDAYGSIIDSAQAACNVPDVMCLHLQKVTGIFQPLNDRVHVEILFTFAWNYLKQSSSVYSFVIIPPVINFYEFVPP